MKNLLKTLLNTDYRIRVSARRMRGNTYLHYLLLTVFCLLFTATSFATVTNITSGVGYSTLSNAVFAAGIGDTLLVSTGIYYETIDVYNKDLTIEGKYKSDFSGKVASGKSIISAPRPFFSYSGSTFDVTNSTLILSGLDITKGGFAFSSLGSGGGIDASYDCDIKLYSCNIYTNFCRGNGGGIYLYDSELYATNTHIFGNNAYNASFIFGDNACGGGIYVSKSIVRFRSGCKIFSNNASGKGGGMRLKNSVAEFLYSNIHGNYADEGGGVAADSSSYNHLNVCYLYNNLANKKGGGILLENNSTATNSNTGSNVGYKAPWGANMVTNGSGGGVYIADSTLILKNRAAVANNSATEYGGGIFMTNGTLIVDGGFVGIDVDNYTNSAYQGGGIFAMDSILNITNSTVAHGLAGSGGGGILILNCSTIMKDSKVINNWSPGYGGGILIAGSNNFNASHSSFNNNEGVYGGGITLYSEVGDVNFDSCSIISNNAESGGGLLLFFGSSVNISGTSVIGYNIAQKYGGGIFAFLGEAKLYGDKLAPLAIMKNMAANDGGGIYAFGSYVEGEGNVWIGMNEASSGGGIFVTNNPSLTLTNLLSIAPKIFGNIAENDGGGIFITGSNSVAKLYNTSIGLTGNGNKSYAKYGPGNGGGGLTAMNSARVGAFNCGFVDNFSSNSGGGAYFGDAVVLNIDSYDRTSYQSYFHNNTARNAGGGLYINNSRSVNIENTYIVSNKTQNGISGGIYVFQTFSKFVNLVVVQNDCGLSSGADGIAFNNCLRSEMLQCTVADNDRIGIFNNFSATLYMTNCIVYGHSLSQLWDKAEIKAVYSDIQGGWPGTGNINANPLFDDPANLNYRIVVGSPCEDAGTTLLSITNDIAGTVRPQGSGYDMGAFEVVPEPGMVFSILYSVFGIFILFRKIK